MKMLIALKRSNKFVILDFRKVALYRPGLTDLFQILYENRPTIHYSEINIRQIYRSTKIQDGGGRCFCTKCH